MKQYTSRQWALGAAAAGIMILIAVVATPWYSVSMTLPSFPGIGDVPGFSGGTKSQSLHGTDEPFLGVWDIVLGILAAAAAAGAVIMAANANTTKAMLGASAALYLVVAVLGIVDGTRNLETGTFMGGSASKGIGPWSVTFMAVCGVIMAAYAIVMLNKERGAAPASQPPPASS